MISIPFVKSQLFAVRSTNWWAWKCGVLRCTYGGLPRFRAPFRPCVGFLRIWQKKPNWNSKQPCAVGSINFESVGDGQAPPLMTEILISWVHKPQRNWVDDHPPLHENNGSLDGSACGHGLSRMVHAPSSGGGVNGSFDPSTNGIYISRPAFKPKFRPHHLTLAAHTVVLRGEKRGKPTHPSKIGKMVGG